MSLSLLAPGEMPELLDFLKRLPLDVRPENLTQFWMPRTTAGGSATSILVLREAGTIIASIGWIDVPLRINDDQGHARTGERHKSIRWPVNFYVLAELRGKGLGHRLLEATRDGATLRAAIGGAIKLLERTGFRSTISLVCARWVRPCLDPARLGERLRGGERRPPPDLASWRIDGALVRARRLRRFDVALPWADRSSRGAPGEAGVPRDAAYLEFAFGGVLGPYHASYVVDVDGTPAGHFVLAARAGRRFLLVAEIVDLDAMPGREKEVIEAARRTALACADMARLRISGARFTRVLEGTTRGIVTDQTLRIVCDEPWGSPPADWRMTYGDHDHYRARASSLAWRTGDH